MQQKFAAPWGKQLRLMTIVLSAILLGIPCYFMLSGPERLSQAPMVVVVPLALVLGSLLFTIRGYELTNDALRVQRLLWWNRIDLSHLKKVFVDPNAMNRSIRTFGNGGLFSFSGRFRNQELGSYRAFVTDPARAVVLRFTDQIIVVTPDRPELFAAALQNMLATTLQK